MWVRIMLRRGLWLSGLGVLFASARCGSVSVSLPSAVEVELPDESIESAERGEGAESLAGTQWALYDADSGRFLTMMVFGDDGSLDALVENSAVAEEFFGDDIIADGKSHGTDVEGLSYAAATYGTENESGFAYEVRATARYSNIPVGRGEAYAIGTHDGETMQGTFGYEIRVTAPVDIALPDGVQTQDEFDIHGVRVD